MRFVWAVVALVLATVMIGAGIAQRTIFEPPRSTTSEVEIADDTAYAVIPGTVLNSLPGTQTVRVIGDGTVFAAYGRTSDVQAWLSDVTYSSVSVDDEGVLTTEVIEPEPVAVAEDAETTTEDGTEPTRNPEGSDLWYDQYTGDGAVIAPLQLGEDLSIIVASDGTEPVPGKVTITWPLENATPWAGPLIVGGGILMAVGVLLYLLGIRHVRRSRGPRRKGLPLPPTEPIDLAQTDGDKGVISAGRPRRSITGRARTLAAVPLAGVVVASLVGCTADDWPDLIPTQSPSPTASVIVPEGQQQPAVTQAQAQEIVARVAATVAQADTDTDAALAATRLTGPTLAVRETNYTLRDAIADYAAPEVVPDDPLQVVLPQAFDGWPRSFLAIANDADTNMSTIMVLTQEDAWSEYRLSYYANLGASTLLPELAPPYIGASLLAPHSAFLVIPPDELAAAYADVLTNGDSSEYAALFESEDQFRASVAADRQTRLDEFNETGAETGTLDFSATAGDAAPFAIATLESGAIVAVNVYETDTVTPTNEDAVIKLEGNDTVKTLAGADQSSTGFSTTFSDQLFFYVPAAGSTEKIQLLGYSSAILEGSVL
ncbi:hypothetical protein GCM10009808_05950 [Microbacterium sediminicola]|uniref:DUF8094 domain-containing protein n=1 Tax=Microbacterium sediminicola TaxID=415210 RepID=A0ABP4TQ63_9MICO